MNENKRIALLAIFWTVMAAAVLAILFLPPSLQDCLHVLRDRQPPAFFAVAGSGIAPSYAKASEDLDDNTQN